MTPDELQHATCYPSAQQGREDAIPFVETPQTVSPTYKLAFDDTDFLVRDDMRGVRLQLEMMKPEVELQANNIHSTIVVFGSARAADPVQDSDGPLAKYYGEARRLEHHLAPRTTPKRLRDPGAVLPIPLFRHPQDAFPDACPCHGRLPRRVRDHGRAIRNPHAHPDQEDHPDPSPAVR